MAKRQFSVSPALIQTDHINLRQRQRALAQPVYLWWFGTVIVLGRPVASVARAAKHDGPLGLDGAAERRLPTWRQPPPGPARDVQGGERAVARSNL